MSGWPMKRYLSYCLENSPPGCRVLISVAVLIFASAVTMTAALAQNCGYSPLPDCSNNGQSSSGPQQQPLPLALTPTGPFQVSAGQSFTVTLNASGGSGNYSFIPVNFPPQLSNYVTNSGRSFAISGSPLPPFPTSYGFNIVVVDKANASNSINLPYIINVAQSPNNCFGAGCAASLGAL